MIEHLATRTTIDPTTGCWLWKGGSNENGYGRMRLANPRRMVYPHRFAFEAVNGPIPAGMQVLHSCDNPRCCNPEHLRIGTQSENIRESWDKGRQVGRWGRK